MATTVATTVSRASIMIPFRRRKKQMEFPPLIDGVIIARYKRFLADVRLADGQVVIAHCPNTGAMKGCWAPGAPVQLSAAANPRRKLRWTLERVDMGAGWVGVNSARVNHIIAHFITAGDIQSLHGYQRIRKEPRYRAPGFPDSRFDLLLGGQGRADCYVEVKNTTLVEGAHLCFPDAVTERGRKHLELLQHAVRGGYRGVLVFAANRPEGNAFRAAGEVDPVYAETLERVREGGVEVIVVRIRHTESGVAWGGEVPMNGSAWSDGFGLN